MTKIRYFETFAGVGGIGQGLPKDWKLVGLSENDRYASMVLNYHYPKIKNYGDIKKIRWEEVADFDLLTGGSPCQDFSIAGKRRGLAGSKSSLAWEFIRGLRSKKPKYFLWENVKGVMSSRGGWDFANLLVAFSESGYSIWWQVLNAKEFGVPQNRERIFVVGFRKESAKEIFFERRIGEETFIKQINDPRHSNDRVFNTEGISPTLNTMQGGNRQPFVVASRGRNTESGKSGLPTEQMLEPNLEGIANTLTSVEKDNYVFITQKPRGKNKGGDHKISPTLSCNSWQDNNHLSAENKIRKLMPIECERLMGWGDNWTKFGRTENGKVIEISDNQRYKMCGNGVVSNVIREISNKLF